MTDNNLDQAPADTGTDTTGSVGTDKAPASAPAADAGHNEADDGDIDLLDGYEGEEGGEPADASAAQQTDAGDRPAWQRPEGLDGDALAEWKERQGLPTDVAGYEIKLDLREGEQISEVGQQLIDGLKDFAVENDLPPPAINSLANWYNKQIEAHQTRLAESDRTLRAETRDVLTERWGDTYADRMQIAKEGVRVLPQALRQMLKEARTPDGKRITHTPEFALALYEIGRLRGRKGNTVPPTDDQRLAEITKVMNSDIDAYRAQGLDKERLDIMRKREGNRQSTPSTLTPAEAQEAADLVQMMQTDIDTYRYKPYRGTGRPAADRLLQLQRKQAGEAA
jgi:hypothetical protein